MKAKLGLKPVDEARTAAPSAMLKKKDPIPENKPLGSKPISAAASTVASAQAARPVTAAPAPVQTAAPTTAASAADTAATATAAPVKRGIFGFLSNSKKNIITSTPAGSSAGPATTNSAAPVAPSALSSSGGSLFSPSAQSSARSAAPAMVDSIIKSAKMDSAPAAAPTPVSAPIQKASPSEQPSDASKGPLGGSGGKIAGTPGAPLNNAFASKSLISNIVNNYNNAVKSTPAPAVVASTPAAVKPATAPSAAAAPAGNSVLRDITPAAGNAPASAVKAAPAAVPATPSSAAPVAAASAVNEYIIEDRDDSDEEGSGTDGEKEEGEGTKPKQNVPDWARGPLLKEALERQYGMGGQVPVDPDLIFPEVTTCSLEEIFGAREGLSRKYANRSSSAHWDADQMTLVEKRVYRKHMGYDRGQQQTGATPLGAK